MIQIVDDTSNGIHNLTRIVDERRLGMIGKLDPEHKSAWGQFMTPYAVSKFMASLFSVRNISELRLLDAGAGIGSLTAAYVEEVLSRKAHTDKITVTGYEIDPILTRGLQDTFVNCSEICDQYGTKFEASVIQHDFIEVGVRMNTLRLFDQPNVPTSQFTHAILNPPYKKIHSASPYRRLLRSFGIEASNLYTAFLSIAIKLLEEDGELVAITPRSFCNGPYFRPFRQLLDNEMSLKHMHIFESRTHTFKDDQVLQETIIFHAIKNRKRGKVMLSISADTDFSRNRNRIVDYSQIVHPNDSDLFVHITSNENDQRFVDKMKLLPCTLDSLNVDASTGPVVDFRLKEYLRCSPEPGTVSLIYPAHCRQNYVVWPANDHRKANAIVDNEEVQKWLYPNGYYVVVRRFSSKEERRRIVACIHDPSRIPGNKIGFENHLNILHQRKGGLKPSIAKGLAMFLNSTFYDVCFRQFSGHTQVNVKDIQNMRYPSLDVLEKLSNAVKEHKFPDQEEIDSLIEKEILS